MVKSSIAVLALALFAWPAQDALRSTPEKDLVLRKVFERRERMELTAMDMTVDGTSHGGMEQPEWSFEVREDFVFLDRCADVVDGRATKLARTFERLAGERVDRSSKAPEGSQEQSSTVASELEGRTVEFTWDEEAADYAVDFTGDGGDSALLENLAADLDLSAFLPSSAVSEGDRWEVPAHAFTELLCPGGDLKLASGPSSGKANNLSLAENLSGTIRASLGNPREEDGQTLAVIDLELELEAQAEYASDDGEGTQRHTNVYELSGELTWNPAAGRFHALELGGSLRTSLAERDEVEMQERAFLTERTYEFEGEVSYSVRAETP